MARRVNDVYGGRVAKKNPVRFRFQRFRSGNVDLQNKPRWRPETLVDNEELKAIVEADPLHFETSGDAGAQTVNATGCGFDPYSNKWNI